MANTKGRKCSCGHWECDHDMYENGRNARGSRYVCVKDNCTHWKYCTLTDAPPLERTETETDGCE